MGVILKKTLFFLLVIIVASASITWSQGSQPARMSPEKAGKIDVPLGKIAFIRDGDLWVMDWDGKNQYKVVTAENADGKISWAPDGRRLAFTRKGRLDYKAPDYMGGQHSLYDIFIAYLDSAEARNTVFWRRLTMGLGGRYPEWRYDGKTIVYTNDINANQVDAEMPNYQTCTTDTLGQSSKMMRKDYKDTELFAIMPTVGPGNQCAAVLYKKFNPLGIIITPLDQDSLSMDKIGKEIKFIGNATAPAWSPDGRWIAYVDVSDISNQRLNIVSPDLTEQYLVFQSPPGRNLQTYPLSWSPNSKWITFATDDGVIWIIDIAGNQLKQIGPAGNNTAPAWSKTK
jgi:Tol biopolymer transport system component